MSTTKTNHHVQQLKNLIDIGVTLSSEKELSKLIEILLDKSIEVTGAEGACFYLLQQHSTKNFNNIIALQKETELHLLKSLNRRIGQREENLHLKVSADSLAGYVAQTQQLLNIEDIQKISKKQPYKIFSSVENNAGYGMTSILSLPMLTADGKIRGVLQVMNKISEEGLKKFDQGGEIDPKDVLPFSSEDEELMTIFSSYAAIAIENAQLTESIENLFESFVRASVKAIEARDPTTSGHSDRVAMMTVELALATHKIGEGPYKGLSFSEEQIKEIRYASLLHDFGKIGVTEPVLLKKKKLLDRELESILLRFDSLVDREESKLWRNLCEKLVEDQKEIGVKFDIDQAVQNANAQIDTLKARVHAMRSQVITANEPQVMSLDFDINTLIAKITRSNEFFGGKVLTQNEIKTLSIPRGSLTAAERQEIESHVSHTYEFLKQIAWTGDLTHVTEIAHSHHEKMDGSGYPRGIQGEQIPIQARMMTIADIYDALTAFDRPYKKSLPPARALEILVKDARAEVIDGHLLKIFIEAGIFHFPNLRSQKKAS